MNKYLVEKLKEGRLSKGLKQSDVTKLTGIKNTTLSNYENGNTEPDMDTFLRLCDLYDLNYSEIISEAYGYRIPGLDFDVRSSDIALLKKYHILDDHGREMVDIVLDKEHERCESAAKSYKNATKSQLTNKVTEFPAPYTAAAHERTDIDVTEDMRKHDDDIMMDDSEWE